VYFLHSIITYGGGGKGRGKRKKVRNLQKQMLRRKGRESVHMVTSSTPVARNGGEGEKRGGRKGNFPTPHRGEGGGGIRYSFLKKHLPLRKGRGKEGGKRKWNPIFRSLEKGGSPGHSFFFPFYLMPRGRKRKRGGGRGKRKIFHLHSKRKNIFSQAIS